MKQKEGGGVGNVGFKTYTLLSKEYWSSYNPQ